MSRWFRYYEEALTDPKVQSLPDAVFKRWVNLLCIASQNNGLIPPYESLNLLLAGRYDHLKRHVNDLINRGLIEEVEGGFTPHNWFKRQYKSDFSKDRMKKLRDVQAAVTVTAPVTPPETEKTETERKKEESKNTGVVKPDAMEPTPSAPVHPPPAQLSLVPDTKAQTPKSELYNFAAQVLGKDAGAAVAKLLKFTGDDIPKVRRCFELAKETSEPKRYVFGAIQKYKDLFNREELDQAQIDNWRPKNTTPPKREDWGKQRFYIISKVDNAKKLYLDTARVWKLIDEKAEELGVCL